MRTVPAVGAVSLIALFSACNAILGNESHYELVGSAGESAEAGASGTAGRGGSGGKAGSAGSSNSVGGTSSGKGGSANATGGKGGSGGNGTGAGGGAGDGGAGDSAGASGEAGAPTCVSSGPEACFNRIDDDCNGDVDCEDSACAGPAECRPATEGADLGYFTFVGDTCLDGYTQLDLHKDIQVPYACNGCSCINPTAFLCDTSAVALRTGSPCPGFETMGNSQNIFNDRCGPLPTSTNLHYYSIRGTAQCTPSGTPTLDPVTWAESMVFCMLDTVGAGCGATQACLPAEAGQLCTLTDGDEDCTEDFASDHGTWYEGLQDSRSCGECQCGLGTSDCSGAYIAAYADGACGGTATQLGNGAQGDACGLPAPFQSARIIGTPTNGSCQPNNFVNGDAMPTGQHKACCQP